MSTESMSCLPLFPSSLLDTFRPGRLIFGVISFCLFIHFMGFSRRVYWSGVPFLPPVDHILSEPSAVTRLSWVTPHGMAHSFFELHKPLHHEKALIHEGDCQVALNKCLDKGHLLSAFRHPTAVQLPLAAGAIHSSPSLLSRESKSMPQPVLRKLKLNSSMKTYKTF